MALSLLLLLLSGVVLAAHAARAPAPIFFPTVPPPPSDNLLSPYGSINLHPLSLDNAILTSMENIVPKTPQKSPWQKAGICFGGIGLVLVVITATVEFFKKLWKQNRKFLIKIFAKLVKIYAKLHRPAKEDAGEEIFFDVPEEFIDKIAPEQAAAASAPTREPAAEKISWLSVVYEVMNGLCTIGVAIWALYTYIQDVKDDFY